MRALLTSIADVANLLHSCCRRPDEADGETPPDQAEAIPEGVSARCAGTNSNAISPKNELFEIKSFGTSKRRMKYSTAANASSNGYESELGRRDGGRDGRHDGSHG